jgi:hypothetical protein
MAFDRVSCPAEGDFASGYPLDLESGDGLYTTALKLEGYKTRLELDRYFTCWKEDDNWHHLYFTQYKGMIEDAAKASGIPFQILACLVFFESKFNRKALSQAGAKGLAQTMPTTWDDMKDDLDPKNARLGNGRIVRHFELALEIAKKNKKAIDPEIRDAVQQMRKIYDEKWDKDKWEMRDIDGLNSMKLQLERLEKFPAFEPKDRRVSLTQVETALNRIYTQKLYADYVKARQARGDPSPLTAQLFDAEYSVVLGAIRLRRVYKDVFDRTVANGTHDQWVIAGGAYNIGPGKVRCKGDMSADECIRITKDDENREHMQGIKNCSESGNKKNKQNKSPKGAC